MTEAKYPQIAEFVNDEPLLLTPHPNGGWTVSQVTFGPERDRPLGAFSTASHMLVALSGALVADNPVENKLDKAPSDWYTLT